MHVSSGATRTRLIVLLGVGTLFGAAAIGASLGKHHAASQPGAYCPAPPARKSVEAVDGNARERAGLELAQLPRSGDFNRPVHHP